MAYTGLLWAAVAASRALGLTWASGSPTAPPGDCAGRHAQPAGWDGLEMALAPLIQGAQRSAFSSDAPELVCRVPLGLGTLTVAWPLRATVLGRAAGRHCWEGPGGLAQLPCPGQPRPPGQEAALGAVPPSWPGLHPGFSRLRLCSRETVAAGFPCAPQRTSTPLLSCPVLYSWGLELLQDTPDRSFPHHRPVPLRARGLPSLLVQCHQAKGTMKALGHACWPWLSPEHLVALPKPV